MELSVMEFRRGVSVVDIPAAVALRIASTIAVAKPLATAARG